MRENMVNIENLRMSYGDKEVLKGINLKIQKGNIIGYIGPNGAGKSTTVKIMLGLITGYSGKVEIFGEDISKSGEEYKRKIGYVPEIADVYESLTGREYLTFVGQLYGMDLEEADKKGLALMEVLGIANSYDARISSYSKGMKQKILIISSLIHDPELLFFDEPLSGLDANSVMVIKELLALLAKKGKTIFYSSHIMEIVEKVSDRIILINNGEIIADGSFEELKNTTKDESLETIFNELTGFNEHGALAQKFVDVISNEVPHEGV
ncbi:MAG: ABC transporter ATP-binding protein [Clostridium sp.]